MSFTNALPWWGALLIAGVMGVVAWLAYASSAVPRPRRDALIALRFVTLAALVVFLLGPVRVRNEGLRDVYKVIYAKVKSINPSTSCGWHIEHSTTFSHLYRAEKEIKESNRRRFPSFPLVFPGAPHHLLPTEQGGIAPRVIMSSELHSVPEDVSNSRFCLSQHLC